MPTVKKDFRSELSINLTSVERVLHRSSLIGIGEFRCPVEHPQFVGGGPQTCPYIVFPRTSVRINVVSLHNIGDSYDRHRVSREGDQSDWIAVSPQLLREIAIAHVDGRHVEANRLFAQPFAPMPPNIYLAQRALFRAVQDGADGSSLAVEEYVIALVDLVLESAARYWRQPGWSARRTDATAIRRQRAITEDAKAIMAVRYREPLSVTDIAQAVHCSPGYLCRTFKRVSSSTLHGYLQQLRLRASLQLLADSWMNLAGIAEHLGFATHSHFTDVFRRQFGMTPTQFTQRKSMRWPRELTQSPSMPAASKSHRSDAGPLVSVGLQGLSA